MLDSKSRPIGSTSFALFIGLMFIACEPKPATIEPAFLEVVRPFQMGQSPQGISKRKTFTFKNGGGERLTISDFDIDPNNGVFHLSVPSLPLVIGADNSIELEVTFRPNSENKFAADLSIDYNHGDSKPSAIPLKGEGISHLVCLPCTPPPPPECALDGEVYIYYEPTDATDCESEEDTCSYLVFEESCDDSPCDPEIGHCHETAPTDSGSAVPITDSGSSWEMNDSGSHATLLDSGSYWESGDAGSLGPLRDAGHFNAVTDAGGHPVFDSGTADPCHPISCPENTVCQEGVCECVEGYIRFDAGAQCSENCVVMGCDDNDLCTTDSCNASGDCSHTGTICNAPPNPYCYEATGSCDPTNGLCGYNTVNGACDDGDLCTLDDQCQDGTCFSGNTKACNNPPNPQCQEAVGDCDPTSGNCSYDPVIGDCEDGDFCTLDDQCNGGVCVSGGLKVCNNPQNPQCQQALGDCNPDNGNCSYPPKAGGCEDGDLCTLNDQCNNGACVAGANKICNNPPNDVQCHAPAGDCNPATGVCTYAKINGACNDNNPCTINDQCNNGVCAGVPMPCNDSGTVCKSNDGQCINGACVYPDLDGATCDDLDACTQTDTCQGGACVGANPIVCDDHDGDGCYAQGECVNGNCNYPINEGKDCNDGNACLLNDKCQADGTCKGNAPVTCSGVPEPENPCQEIRSTCDPIEGCYQNKPAASDNCCDGLGGYQGGQGGDTPCFYGCERYNEESGTWQALYECCCTPSGECVDPSGQAPDGTSNYEVCGFGGYGGYGE